MDSNLLIINEIMFEIIMSKEKKFFFDQNEIEIKLGLY